MLENENAIAIVGASCRLPGANNLSEYWQLIQTGGSAVTRVPDDRFDRSLFFDAEKGLPGKSYTELGGIVPESRFDHSAWPISDELMNASDTVHLRMLEVCGEALRNAGYDPFSMQGMRSGVYIGHSGGSCLGGDIIYGSLAKEVAEFLADDGHFGDLDRNVRRRVISDAVESIQRKSPSRTAGGGPNLGAHDVSLLVNRAFGLDGPAVAVDAACASSLVAVAQACLALRLGYIDTAIAGGCSYSKWYGLVLFSQAQSVSATGSRPFDRTADGLVSSDGYAAVVLKTEARALADGDKILGVIRNFSVATDGRGKSLWAPRREGQIAAVQRAYYGELSPSSLQYMECHATSTQIGDETEILALADAMRGQFAAGQRIPIGSVKANIGHTLECAGLAGLLKVILAMQNGVIPPQANLTELNPEIPWNNVPFYVPTKAQAWPESGRPEGRRAAVNAFGIGGLNTHFVIDQHPLSFVRSSGARATSSVGSLRIAKSFSAENARASRLAGEPIAIIGMGVVLPGAKSVDEFWDLLKCGKSAISEVPADRWNPALHPEFGAETGQAWTPLGGFIRGYEFDWRKHKVPPKQIANSNPLQYLLLDATDQTFRDAGYHERSFDRSRTSAVVGTVFDGDFGCQMQMGLRLPALQRELRRAFETQGLSASRIDELVTRFREYALEKMPALLDETGSFTSSTLASRLTKTFDLMGGAWAMDTSDISSLGAIQASVDLLHTGLSDMVLCAAGQRSMDATIYEALRLQGFLAKKGVHPPFDAIQNGFVPGEGAAVVLLKRLSDAQRDGDRIRAVIRGVSISSSANGNSESLSRTVLKNVRGATANLSGSHERYQVEAVESARAMKSHVDAAELQAFDQSLSHTANRPVFLGSVVSQLGHLKGASGMVSLVKSVLEIEHGEISPACGFTGAGETLRQTQDRFAIPTHSQPLSPTNETRPLRVLISNLSASGLVAHLALEGITAVSPTPVMAAIKDSETTRTVVRQPKFPKFAVARFGAATMAELHEQIVRKKDSAEALTTATERMSGFFPSDRCRLAIVGVDESDVRRKLSVACGGFTEPARRHVLADNGIFIGECLDRRGSLAVVFSGQGAQYTGMLKDWAESSPAMRSRIQQMDQVLAQQGVPSFSALAWEEGSKLGVDVLNTQLAVLVADLAAWAALDELGIHPDVIAGHSYGEFPALVAAGVWQFEEAVRGTLFRTQAVEACGIREAAMLSTAAPVQAVRDLITKNHLACDIACYNAPDQTIVAGTARDLNVLKNAFQEIGAASREIRVPRPYHSRLMSPAQPLLAESLGSLSFARPNLEFVSSVTLQKVDSPQKFREALVAQLTQPVRYQELVEQLVHRGVSAILECGPKQILARLNRQILRNESIILGCVDARPGHVEEQKLRLQLMLECIGMGTRTQIADRVISANTISSESPTLITTEEKTHKMVLPTNSRGEIHWADATERRRQKMRENSSTKGRVASTLSSSRSSSRHDSESISVEGHGGNGRTRPLSTATPLAHRESSFGDGKDDSDLTTVVIARRPSGVSSQRGDEPNHSEDSHSGTPNTRAATSLAAGADAREMLRDKLEAFILDLVVDQTGHPPEFVNLDANLEADMGIDDLRKARLLRKVSEQFELTQPAISDASISLDDFPTLGTIVDFFVKVGHGESTAPISRHHPVRPRLAARNLTEIAAKSPSTVLPAAKPTPPMEVLVDRSAIEEFVVNFVIDQTGYPKELVTTDASLEADLGIDSIRKAQLIGEVAEKFGLAHLAAAVVEKSLDDFPTLDAIINFVSSPSTVEPKPVSNASVVSDLAASRPWAAEPVRKSVERVDSTPSPQPSVPRIDRGEMEQFVIDFVIEETGYPRELIELNASLEADLGIDSIRKARLLGEVAERFQIQGLRTIVADISLDDFPTLGAIVEFFLRQGNATPSAATEKHRDVTSRFDDGTTDQTELQPRRVVPTAEISEGSMPVQRLTPPIATTGLDSVAQIDRQELEKFCIAYVIEQTGYPEELIELDASLEADLGIDSIRKAQLLGEVAEHFQVKDAVSAAGTTSLDDFPTLATIVSFFCRLGGVAEVPAVSISSGETSSTSLRLGVFDSDLNTPAHHEKALPQETGTTTERRRTLIPEAERVMRRYILRSVSEPLEANESRTWPLTGTALIVGDGPLAIALREHLISQGNSAELMKTTGADWRQAVEELNRLWVKRPLQHLFLLTSSPTLGSEAGSETFARDLYVAYFVCQRWIQLRNEAGATVASRPSVLCAVTRLGGDFGVSQRIGNVSGAALTGLLKGIRREYPDLIVKVLDTPDNEPDRLIVEALHRELSSRNQTLEVGCVRGHRQRLRMVPQPASSIPSRGNDLSGVWVITGGGRGITARIARELGQHSGVKLHLLGRSPVPNLPADWQGLDANGLVELKHRVMREANASGRRPIDAWKQVEQAIELDGSLREFRKAGLDVTYHACDVRNRESVAQVLDVVRSLHGPIRGVIHGAGLEAAARFERKPVESVIATVETKVTGAVWLWELTAQDPLKFFVAFGSTSGRFGGVGQTDYSMASDLLCRLCSQLGSQGRDCRVVGIHWPPWDEVGMAVRPESQFALRASGLTFLKPAEGISHLFDELLVCSTETEVAFVDSVWDVSPAELDRDRQMVACTRQFAGALSKSPLLRTIIDQHRHAVTVECLCDPAVAPWLNDHRFDGVVVVPGTFLMEMCLEAASLLTEPRTPLVVEGFEIQHGVRLHSGNIQRLRVSATQHPDGCVECLIQGEFTDTKNRVVELNRTYATARIVPSKIGDHQPISEAPPKRWQEFRPAATLLQFDVCEVGTVYHGQSLSALRGIADESQTGAWFRISLDGCGSDVSQANWTASPVILDAALQACDVLRHRSHGTSQLPSRVDRLRIFGDLRRTTAMRVCQVGEDAEGSTWNIVVVDQLGQVLAELHGAHFSRVRTHLRNMGTAPRELTSSRTLLRTAQIIKTDDGLEARVLLDPSRDKFLAEHRLRSKPLLPVVITLELMAEAAELLCLGSEHPHSIRDVRVHSGIRFSDLRSRELLIRCRRQGERVEVQLIDSINQNRTAVAGTVILGSQAVPQHSLELTPPAQYFDYVYPEQALMEHGPSMRTLRKLCLKRNHGWGQLQSAPVELIESANWIFAPAILDGALMACGTDAWFMMDCQTEIPSSFDTVTLCMSAARSGTFTVLLRFREKQESGCLYDFTIYDAENRPYLEVQGYASNRVQQGSTGSST